MVDLNNNSFSQIRSIVDGDGDADDVLPNYAEIDPEEIYIHTDEDTDSDITDIVEEIVLMETDFVDMEKQHNKYYLGSVHHFIENNLTLMTVSVSVETVFRYSINDVQLYLAEYENLIRNDSIPLPTLHIIKLHISDNLTYQAIVKTCWLKIIQRTWKKQFAKREMVLQLRGGIQSQRHFELTGKYPKELQYIPGLHGMLVF